MMARIRTIKPEFWEDEVVAALSPMARLLFIGSWNLADDEGLLRWTPDYINASLFMYDDLTARKIEALMAEIVEPGLVFPYMGGDRQKLAYVVNFRKHQRINRPQPGKFPPPNLQNPNIQQMYGRRDSWRCHLCAGPVNEVAVFMIDPYTNKTTIPGEPDLNLSIDHVDPRSLGGSDYPSNLAASHVGCNKARKAKPIHECSMPLSVRNALGLSLNDSVNDSPPERKGREGKGSSSSDDDERLNDTWLILAKRLEAAGPHPIRAFGPWFRVVRDDLRLRYRTDVHAILEAEPTLSARELAQRLDPPPTAEPGRPRAVEDRPWCDVCDCTHLVRSADGTYGPDRCQDCA